MAPTPGRPRSGSSQWASSTGCGGLAEPAHGPWLGQRSRARLVHRAEGGRPRQRHLRSQANAQPAPTRNDGASRTADLSLRTPRAVLAATRTAARATPGLAQQDVNSCCLCVYGASNNVYMRVAKVPAVRQAEANSGDNVTICSTATPKNYGTDCTTRRKRGRAGGNPRRLLCRGSCGSTCSST